MDNIFIQLAIILSLSSVLGFITYRLKLPLLIAYLFGGLLLALTATFDVTRSYALSFLPDIGIAFLLFLVGMELDLREIRSLGKQILIAGILQVLITATLGAFLAQSFGFGLREAIYLGIGLSFSSTLVVIKLLIDRKDLTSLYGKLSVGILLLEDLIAVIILLGMTSSTSLLTGGTVEIFPIATFVVKVFLLFAGALLIARYVLSSVFKAVSTSAELLFLTALAWCFAYISLALLFGFSVLIGAFLAGVALASSPYHFQIQGKIKPMRDFFTMLFFVYLGTRVNFLDLAKVYPLILAFVSYAVLFKPVIFLLLFGMFGFKKHTMFHAAVNLSQVSEFSLIILLLGFQTGIVTSTALTVIALSSVLSFIASSLMISNSHHLYKSISSAIAFFERPNHNHLWEKGKRGEMENHVVVIGAHRVGGEVVRFLKKEKMPQIVLDFNPHQVEALLSEGIPVAYGDMGDPEVLDILNLERARMVISTSQDVSDNKTLLEDLKARHISIPTIVRSETAEDASSLYKMGADFVIIPDILAGDTLLEIIKGHLGDESFFKDRARIELEKLSRKTLAWE